MNEVYNNITITNNTTRCQKGMLLHNVFDYFQYNRSFNFFKDSLFCPITEELSGFNRTIDKTLTVDEFLRHVTSNIFDVFEYAYTSESVLESWFRKKLTSAGRLLEFLKFFFLIVTKKWLT